jgi:two-component system OmpR family response regulator
MKILLAEDDAKTADFIASGLGEMGHSVDHVSDGRDALTYCLYKTCDLAILDRMMPGMDGLSVVKALRAARKDLPVLILSAMADVTQRVEGLAAGADDYLVKPFHFSELAARVVTLSRRRGEVVQTSVLTVADLTLDLLSRSARRGGQAIDLQAKEFALLEVLMRHAGRVVTRTMLLEQVWNFNFEPNTTVVETHVSRLRAKVDKPFATALIQTVRSTGYMINGPR